MLPSSSSSRFWILGIRAILNRRMSRRNKREAAARGSNAQPRSKYAWHGNQALAADDFLLDMSDLCTVKYVPLF